MREVMSRFCSGLTVITGTDPATGDPIGFTCQSFSSLSLEPPLIMIAPSRTSKTWARISESGAFTVNVLAEHQEWVSRTFGRPIANKFASVPWRPGTTGAPRIASSAAWVDCTVHAQYDGGDHHIIVGAVKGLDVSRYDRPLLFHRSAYSRL
jgi:flavin reductase (DIM6/NTAB) family NADH-FMN oxidoreductase RutF